jgi:hypothetical protein
MVVLDLGAWLWRFRRCAARAWERLPIGRKCGFTLFVDGSGQWLGLAAWFYGQEKGNEGRIVSHGQACAA